MNIEELIEALETTTDIDAVATLVEKSILMLRQQANRLTKYELRHQEQRERIAELEEDNEAFVKIASDEHKIAVEQEQRVLELEKQIKDAVEVGIAEGFVRAHKETPYEIGQRIYKTGGGIYNFWESVEKDEDMAECQRGYIDAKIANEGLKDLLK